MATIWRYEVHVNEINSGQEFISHAHFLTDVPVGDNEPSGATVLNLINNYMSTSSHNMNYWVQCMYDSAQLVRTLVRSEVKTWEGEISEVAEEAHSLAGALALGGADQLPSGMSAWIKYRTGVASRNARGGTHVPGGQPAIVLNSVGRFDPTVQWWTNVNNLGTRILGPISNVFGTGSTGDINSVIYSRTRRQRGDSPYTFRLTNCIPDQDPRWVRRRANL